MAGDFYDVTPTGPKRVAAVIGDVSGHGIEPSITAFQVKYLLRVFLRQYRDPAQASVVRPERLDTQRNHTATHLVHAALKEVLGTHVKQAGSVVAPNYLRFDFTHYQPMSSKEVREVEDLVNRYILENHPVTTNMMALEEAMRSGAVAMFGEKYGSEVRVLSVGDGQFSMELCGGTHVRATGDIGSFKITADEAIASGVRRIRRRRRTGTTPRSRTRTSWICGTRQRRWWASRGC